MCTGCICQLSQHVTLVIKMLDLKFLSISSDNLTDVKLSLATKNIVFQSEYLLSFCKRICSSPGDAWWLLYNLVLPKTEAIESSLYKQRFMKWQIFAWDNCWPQRNIFRSPGLLSVAIWVTQRLAGNKSCSKFASRRNLESGISSQLDSMWNLNPKIINFNIARIQKEKETLALKDLERSVSGSLCRFLSFLAQPLL